LHDVRSTAPPSSDQSAVKLSLEASLHVFLIGPIFHFELELKPYLHWRRLCDNTGDSGSQYLLALATLDSTT
jgi:hypothetical protein